MSELLLMCDVSERSSLTFQLKCWEFLKWIILSALYGKKREKQKLYQTKVVVFLLFVMVFGFYREFERFSFLCWVNLISFIVSVPCASCVALSTVSCLTCSRFLFYFGDSVFNVSPVAFFVKVVLLGYNLFCFVIYNYTLEIWLL